MSWQVQEAKQRFGEVLRAVEKGGPQTITRHGEEVAVMVGIADYRRLTGRTKSFVDHLSSMPTLTDEAAAVFDEIEAERRRDFGREVDFGFDE